jgi:hypothetical protein
VGGKVKMLGSSDIDEKAMERTLSRRRPVPQLRAYLRTPETKQRWLGKQS